MSKKNDSTFDYEFLEKLVIGIGEVSLLTQVPTRQIRYWEQKKVIVSLTEEDGKNRRYDYRNIKKIEWIKELMEDGYTLDAASQKITKKIEQLEKMMVKSKKLK